MTTDAPSSVTDVLVATYGSKINIIAGDLQDQSGTTGAAHGSPKKHHFEKHAPAEKPKKHAPAKKPVPKKRAPAVHVKKASPAPGEVHKVRFTLPKSS